MCHIAASESWRALRSEILRAASITVIDETTATRPARGAASRFGYLSYNRRLYHDGMGARLETLWGWWCAAAGHPEIIIRATTPQSDAVRLRCDLAPTGQSGGFDAWRTIGRLLSQKQPVGR